jgi:hypothetical protein
MQQLKENLEIAAKYGTEHANAAQARYAAAYNKRARDKCFDVGDRVLFLLPDSSNKIYSLWQPAVIAEVKTPHSYLVDLPNGARSHVHINKLRPFIADVQTVMYDRDVEFGRVVAAPACDSSDEVVDLMPSQIIKWACISH